MKQFVYLYDDDGEEIYEGYIVEVRNKYETKTSYQSKVYFGANGALIEPHPAHLSLGISALEQLSRFCDYGCGDEHKMGIVSCKIISR